MLPIKPATILKRQIGDGRDAVAGFARQTRIPPRLLKAILSERRAISWPVAIRLGRHFGTGPWYWMALQWRYDHASAPAIAFSARRGNPTRHTLSLMPQGA